LDLRAFGEGLEALARDAGVVDEQILRSVIGGDEAVPLLVAEPLHGSGCQLIHLPLLPTGPASATARVDELRTGAAHSRAFELLLVPEASRDAADVCLLVGEDERAAAAGAAGTACPPHAVHVALVVLGRVEVDDVADALEIEATGRHVGG